VAEALGTARTRVLEIEPGGGSLFVRTGVGWHLRWDGTQVFIDRMTRPLKGSDGALAGVVKVGQDVTERRATKAALLESEERFRQFVEAFSDVLWICDAETLACAYPNPAFEPMYESSRD
jgi:PAS domain-containing protein